MIGRSDGRADKKKLGGPSRGVSLAFFMEILWTTILKYGIINLGGDIDEEDYSNSS